jgi:hypothetical protein
MDVMYMLYVTCTLYENFKYGFVQLLSDER